MNEMLIIIKGLSQNVFLFITLSFVYSLLLPNLRRASRLLQGLIYSVIFSTIAGLGMMMNIELMSGRIIDGRIMMVGICGAYGGPWAGFISALIVSGFRILIGGSGVVLGLTGILGGGVIGSYFWFRKKKNQEPFSVVSLILLGLILTLHAQLWVPILLPFDSAWSILKKVSIPGIIFYSFGTLLIGSLLNRANQHEDMVNSLKRSEKKYRSLFENMVQGVFYQKADGTLVDYNKATLDIFGLTADQFIGKTSLDPQWNVIKKDGSNLPGEKHPSMVALKTGSPVRNEIVGVFNPKKKDYSWIIINAIPQFRDGNDEPYQVFVTLHDITALKNAEDTLDNNENRYRTILYTALDGFWITDVKGNFIEVNKAYCQMSGYREEELLNMQISDVEANETAQETFDHIKTGMEKGYGRFETTHRRKDGSLYQVEVNFSYSDNDGGQFVVFIKDVTEKKQLQTKLQQAHKMESIGNLAGGIAHDFNNLLFPIIGMSELLLEDLPKDSLEYENATEIYHAGRRAGDLVKQILAFSRQSEHKMTPVRVQNVLKEVLKLSRSTIPSNVEIHQDIQQNSGLVLADSTQIHQVAMNLITNALHAVEEKNGAIYVNLKEIILKDNELSDSMLQSGKYIRMSISDNGIGISETIIDKIFEPYFTTKEQGKGTGLGLSVVYGIVKEHGGDIKVHSEVGKGTTFNIYLPLMKKSSEITAVGQESSMATGTESILLVDDEASIAKLEGQMLSRFGYQVTIQTNSIEALNIFKQNPESFDLMISDMTMPNMTGDKLAIEILSIKSNLPIIICTGFNERIDNDQAELIGVKGFLMKPVKMSDLAQMVRKVLDETKIS